MDKRRDLVFTLDPQARIVGEPKPLVSGKKVQKPGSEGDEILPIAHVLYRADSRKNSVRRGSVIS